jgi:hypothetical protein
VVARESVNLVRLRVQPSVSGSRANVKLHAAQSTETTRDATSAHFPQPPIHLQISVTQKILVDIIINYSPLYVISAFFKFRYAFFPILQKKKK